MNKENTIQSFVEARNEEKLLFTAGPGSLLPENLTGLRPCFGRGDRDYAETEDKVLNMLKEMSGHRHIVRLQGSASPALEIMALNFLCGCVLVVSTGYYSDRLRNLAQSAKRRLGRITEVVTIDWKTLKDASGKYDWVWACPTETSCGLRVPIDSLKSLATRVDAKLMLDATASIGLEPGHELAEALAYSSCKGLFGLTGAAFIAFNELPGHEVDSFYLNLHTHIEKLMTGPYHAIASLADVLPRHADFKAAVVANKHRFMGMMEQWLTLPPEHQPLLCTHVSCHLVSDDPRAILYKPRTSKGGSVVCHLGEAHLGRSATGRINEVLRCEIDTMEKP